MNILKLQQSWKTVFSIQDIENILLITENSVRKFLYLEWKKKTLVNISRWLWSIGNDYNLYEFAVRLKKKSYVSLESSLKDNKVIFQHYESIFCVSDNTLQRSINWQTFEYKKLQDSILLNPLGIEHRWNYAIASAERAICDRLYFSSWYYFDSLDWINFEKLAEISEIYNKRVQNEVQQLIKNYAQ